MRGRLCLPPGGSARRPALRAQSSPDRSSGQAVTVVARYGMTVPVDGLPLEDQQAVAAELDALGYTDVWSSEAMGADAFTPLAVAAVASPRLRLGTAIAQIFNRGPGCLAQTAGSLAATAPGRFVLGVGTSSQLMVEQWNDRQFERPYARARDTVRFLREALAGERVDRSYETFSVHGFRLGIPLPEPPKIVVAALRSKMLRLAGSEADGAVINWLSAADVSTVAPLVHEGGADKEVIARIIVMPTTDAGEARRVGARLISTYLTVPVYRDFHRWLGREDSLAETWQRWAAGDRKGATAAVPDEVVDELIVHGTPDECRAHVARYVSNGVTTPVLSILPVADRDQRSCYQALAPVT
jgi:probable F420-dependent oxidoreductase